MASSDDESESVPHTVSNYYFVDQNNEPISLSELPVQWTAGDNPGRERKQIFLHGTADNGLQKIYKQVLAWKFDTTDSKPEIFVLTKDNNWIKLLKPRKSFEDIIRSVLITVYCLHFAGKKPEASGKALWDQLSKDFSSYEIRPSENDLIRHTALISEAVKRDETLEQSKFLMNFLEGKPQEKNVEELRTMPSARFIVDDDMVDEFVGDDESDDEEDLYDAVCSICDNGGEIIVCDGRCMRSFHATEEAGSDSYCASLGWSDEQVEATPSFVCKNCQFKQHQCFVCGELGSSDKLSGAEVFPCVSATCGRFYHLSCVAKLLHRDNAAAIEEFQKKVSAGGTFTCPIHKCFVCKQGEDKKDPDLQFAVCRRCPKSYHRKCLPRKIAFEDDEDEGILQRAWEGLIPNRILIYCLKHEIDDELKTPLRNHITFPGDQPKKKQEFQQFSRREKAIPTKKSVTSEDEISKRNLTKVQKGVRLSSSVEKTNMSKQSVKRVTGYGSLKKSEGKDASRPSLPVLGSRLYDYYNSMSFKGLPEKEHSEKVIEKPEKPGTTDMGSLFRLDNDSKQRIMELMEEATSSVTLEHIIETHKVPTTYGNSKYTVDKSITLGKVEGSVEAIHAALQKLEEGGSIEDAKAVCEPGLLQQMARWKNKMKVYLAPFLYGMRYTSFGRHFTKVDKLNEIVNVLHRYVQDGDMIVDFCCGANDFSWLMKTKLDEIGKKCSYKNFDILQAKNDFNFERKDWMTVQTKELPEGSRLIMGLNPPFGVNAALANKFIDKALEFKPKLVILIVPKETERLDKKKMPYDLIWEDNQLLAGKSFYLPGSVDVNDNQLEDWNKNAPPLYLWSRPDWTYKHMAIAQKHGHLSGLGELSHLQDEEEKPKSLASDLPLEDNELTITNPAPTPLHDHHIAKEEQVLTLDTLPNMAKNLEGEPRADVKEVDKMRTHLSDEIGEDAKKRKRDKEEHARGGSVQTPDKSNERERGKTSGQNLHRKKKRGGKKSHLSKFNVANKQPFKLPASRSEKDVCRERNYRVGQNLASSDSLPRTGYGVAHMDEHERRQRLTSDELCAGPTHQRSGPSPDYGARNLEHFPGHQRESLDSRGFRSQSPYGGVHEQYARSAATPRAGLYESQSLSSLGQRSGFLGSSQDTMYLSSYNHMGLNMEPMMNASAIDRYAPRLGETNNTRMNNPAYEQYGVPRAGYNGYDQFGVAGTGNPEFGQFSAARTGNPGSHAPRPDYRVDSSGFALGPRSFTPQNSSGWLNE